MSANKTIPFASPKLRFDLFKNELNAAFSRVAESNNYILGDEVSKFENSFAEYLGTHHCIGVNSATDGLALSLMALGIKPDDEVITAGLTAPATITSILQIGAKPVIVDILEDTLCIDPVEVKKAIAKKTKAIIPVHLHGFAAAMDVIMKIAHEYNLKVIEDCSQAHGASFNNQKVGTFGDCGVFSFYPTKNLGCMGDGGAIVINDADVASKLKSLRQYGFSESGEVNQAGINSRLDELQAAVLNILLPHLDSFNERRRRYAEQYHTELSLLPMVLPPLNQEAVYHQFPVRMQYRDVFRDKLEEVGVMTGIHYDKAIAEHNAFAPFCMPTPVALKAAKELVSLPIQPEILDKHFESIVAAIKSALR